MSTNKKLVIGAALLTIAPTCAYAQASPTHVPAIVIAGASDGSSGPRSNAQATPMPMALQQQAASASTANDISDHVTAVPTETVRPTPKPAAPLTMPPPIHVMSPSAVLSPKERHGALLAKRWRVRNEMPEPGEDGVVRYLYGATIPSVVCAPLMVCDLALQPGEVVQSVNIGDKVRWMISPAMSGQGATRTTHVIIKPIDAGLITNMVISTSKRVYSIRLVSTQHEWMPLVGFNYPDDVKADWAAYQQQTAVSGGQASAFGGINANDLDFDYRIGGDNPVWKPLRVYTDGSKTYIEFSPAAAHQASPSLVALANDGSWFSNATPQIINYRQIGNRYVVDSVLTRAALISGVGGNQTRVTITKLKDAS